MFSYISIGFKYVWLIHTSTYTYILYKYWFKLLKMNDSDIPKIIYQMLKRDADNNTTYGGDNWAWQIKSILESNGLSFLWLNQNCLDCSFNLIKQRILDVYKQTWYSEINNSSRLVSYCRFKHSFEQEKYLNVITEQKFRIALCKFRSSAHNLAIERGRHSNVQKEDRKCIFCNSGAIENEYHFLLVCSKFDDLRKKYFSKFYCHWPTLNKFDMLMSCDSKKVILNLSKYIFYAEKRRSTEN